MPPNPNSALESWSIPYWTTLAILLTVFVYIRGWLRLRHTFPNLITTTQLAVFIAGLFSLWVAVGSPLETFDDLLLSAHMVQHLLLMIAAPPLILLGAPALPLLHGLPKPIIHGAAGPLLRWPPVQGVGHFLTEPVFCWLAATVALVAWHIPAAFELALRSDAWHIFEHACFFFTSLLFWWPVIQPWPSVARWPRTLIPLYLFLAMLPGGVLSAFLTFSDRILYPSYAAAPRLFAITPLGDQIFAGILMWVFGTFVYLIPAVLILIQVLSLSDARRHAASRLSQS